METWFGFVWLIMLPIIVFVYEGNATEVVVYLSIPSLIYSSHKASVQSCMFLQISRTLYNAFGDNIIDLLPPGTLTLVS